MHHIAVCIAVTVAVFCFVVGILARHGAVVQAATSVYVISLTLTQLLMSELASRPFLYRYPAFVSMLHFVGCWLFTAGYWVVVGDPGKCHPRSFGSARRFLREIVPVALALPAAVACNNIALLYIGPGLNAVIGALTPMATAMLSVLLGRRMVALAWVGLFIALAGAVFVSLSEVAGALDRVTGRHHLIGVAFSLAAVVCRSLKSVLQDRVLNLEAYGRGEAGSGEERSLLAAKNEPISPMHLWAVQSPPMVVVSLAYALCTESVRGAVRHLSLQNAALILITCVSATTLNIMSAVTIKALGASLMQAIGKLNVFVLIAFSVSFLDEVLPLKVAIGAGILLLGILVFERAEMPSAREIGRSRARDTFWLKASKV
mmetsp:Transcript_22725/g.71353  ORF Transcript_22725/g.71353 Transcript_22725/m.71353 type:complete len:374 (+) Transcript_22725:35-1156(+)